MTEQQKLLLEASIASRMIANYFGDASSAPAPPAPQSPAPPPAARPAPRQWNNDRAVFWTFVFSFVVLRPFIESVAMGWRLLLQLLR